MSTFALPRFGIKRMGECFQLIYPEGMIAELDRSTLITLLNLHRESADAVQITDNIAKMLELGMIDVIEDGQISSIEDHFDIKQVLANIDDQTQQFLTMSDLAIFFTDECNYRCKGCSVDAIAGCGEKLDLNKTKLLISEARSLGCTTLALTGGEPILPQHISYLLEAVAHARILGYQKVVVATNGYFLPTYINYLWMAGVTRISVSFLGTSEFMAEYTGQILAHEKALDAIQAVLDRGLHLAVNSVIMKQNYHQTRMIVEKIMPLIENVPHAYLRLSPLISVGRAKGTDDNLEIWQLQSLIDYYLELREKYGNHIRLTCFEDIECDAPMVCDAGVSYLCVKPNGYVSPCDLLQGEITVGNINEHSLTEIWNSPQLDSFRQIHEVNPKCGSCNSRQACFGKCRALSYLRFNSLDMEVSPEECYRKENGDD